jgi:hypothetical protein
MRSVLPAPALPLLLATLLLGGCGGGDAAPERTGEVPEGGACTGSAQCALGHTCAGCSASDAHCLAGCSEDADCARGHCEQVACITCPCVGQCAP